MRAEDMPVKSALHKMRPCSAQSVSFLLICEYQYYHYAAREFFNARTVAGLQTPRMPSLKPNNKLPALLNAGVGGDDNLILIINKANHFLFLEKVVNI